MTVNTDDVTRHVDLLNVRSFPKQKGRRPPDRRLGFARQSQVVQG